MRELKTRPSRVCACGLLVPCPSGWMGAGFHLLFCAKPGGKRVEMQDQGGNCCRNFVRALRARPVAPETRARTRLTRRAGEQSVASGHDGQNAAPKRACASPSGGRKAQVRGLGGWVALDRALLGRIVARASRLVSATHPLCVTCVVTLARAIAGARPKETGREAKIACPATQSRIRPKEIGPCAPRTLSRVGRCNWDGVPRPQ